jgi:hypothetical protein
MKKETNPGLADGGAAPWVGNLGDHAHTREEEGGETKPNEDTTRDKESVSVGGLGDAGHTADDGADEDGPTVDWE